MAPWIHHPHQQLLLSVCIAIILVTFFLHGKAEAGSCRCLPSHECWPDANTWQAFNESIQGALIAAKPLASPCHDPDYDEEACKLVKNSWSDPFWRADHPTALQGPNMEMAGEEGCLLGSDRSAQCSQGAVPMYVVDVSTVSHVQKAVSFAAEHNLRLVIKNTGHDFTGRNTAAGSLSIWMHHLKNITFLDDFLPSDCKDASLEPFPWTFKPLLPWAQRCRVARSTSAVKVGAGVQWEEVYQAAHQSKKTVVGAQCSSVGAAGGYPQGGGHSQISPTFGLAADNVLEYEVVKADGELVIANSCKNSELFWALRGGGGGTFGVVTSVTYVAHPALENLVFASYVITTAAKSTSSTFKDFLTHFISLNPNLSDAGWGGFFILASKTLIVQYLLPNRDMTFAQKTLQPLISYLDDRKDELTILNGKVSEFPSYYDWHLAAQCSNGKCGYPSGSSVYEASRLIPRNVVEDYPSQLAGAMISLQESGYQRVSGYLVGGGRVSWHRDSNAVNPAWRTALLHVLFVKPFADNCTVQTKRNLASELSNSLKILSDMTPGSGSYMNEAAFNDPSWKESFFGSHYNTLKQIKTKVDPKGLFVCNHCVGSEDWSEDLNCPLQ